MSPLRVSIACLLLLVVASAALADGKGFASHAATGSVQTADQRALIVRHEDRQTLVIETNLETADESVAWLIPVPAVPEVTAASDGLFPTLDLLLLPRAVEWVPPYWLLAPLIALPFAVAIAPLPLEGSMHRRLTFLLFLIVIVIASSLLTSFGGSHRITIPALDVHDRQIVDAYETATLEADSARAVLDWLERNDYAVPEGVTPVVADYVEQGWMFVAAKLRQTAGETTLTPAPLTLTFEAQQCVYPMRLTGVDQRDPLTLDLYVLAAGRAEATGLETRAAVLADRPENLPDTLQEGDEMNYFLATDLVPIRHPYLHALTAEFAAGRLVATRLRGKVSPSQMNHDLPINFEPLDQTFRANLYSDSAASGWAVNAAVIACCIGIIGLAAHQRLRQKRHVPVRLAGAVLLISALIGFATYQTLPRGETIHLTMLMDDLWQRHEASLAIAEALNEAEDQTDSLSVDQVRTIVREYMDEMPDQLGALERPRELDAPGHYVVRESGGEIVFAIYDLRAAEHVLWTSDP